MARLSWARMFEGDEGLKAAILGTTSVEDAVRTAGDCGIRASAEDFAVPQEDQPSDAELENAAGGTGSSVYVRLPTQDLCTIRWMCG